MVMDVAGDRAGRLRARPGAPEESVDAGLVPLEGGVMYVPPTYSPEQPAPLAVMLHGARGRARHGLSLLGPLANEAGLVLLAPESARDTWDMLCGGFGPDVERIDALLESVFRRVAVDAARVALGGFSDGASYALSLGVGNGDLFTHLIAFSPGGLTPAARVGMPRVFVSHGDRDGVLPVALCSRRIVPRMARAGYDVLYREFAGAHAVPRDVAREALDWFLGEETGDGGGAISQGGVTA